MKKVISLAMAAMMLLGVLFVFASCGGVNGTYTYDKVEIDFNGNESFKSSFETAKGEIEEDYKNVTLTVDGTKITMQNGDKKEEINCTKDGDKLIPQGENELAEALEMLKAMATDAKIEVYFDTASGLKLVMKVNMTVLTYKIDMTVNVCFKK